MNIIGNSLVDKTSLLSSESSGKQVGVVSKNPTLQISSIKLDVNNYLAWSQSYMLFIKTV